VWQVVHPEGAPLGDGECTECAIEAERRARWQNLRVILDSPLSGVWPQWMAEAVHSESGPGIAPILRGQSESKMRAAMALLADRLQVQSSIYNFNWAGTPIRPAYEPCLAVPVHGMVRNVDEMIRDMCQAGFGRIP